MQKIGEAHKNALLTAVVVSRKTDRAYYQREEIVTAIQRARDRPQDHRVVPIFLEHIEADSVPYGLNLKHSLRVSPPGDLSGIAKALIDLID
jgi:hypothetical protein